jgi:hypothetical protein
MLDRSIFGSFSQLRQALLGNGDNSADAKIVWGTVEAN